MSHLRAYSMQAFSQRQFMIKTLGAVFSEAAGQRNQRSEFVRDMTDNTHVPGWVIYEREQMFGAINAERAKMGKEPIELRSYVRAENCAKGHSDYAKKLALYATELVFDDFRGP